MEELKKEIWDCVSDAGGLLLETEVNDLMHIFRKHKDVFLQFCREYDTACSPDQRSLLQSLNEILQVCGTVNYSSPQQMKDAIEDSIGIAQTAIKSHSQS